MIYLIFNEGYSATAGDDWMRPQLCEEALRLGRILAELAPAEPEVHGLVALMEIQASRLGARTGPDGEPVLLLDQNRARWDQLLIRRGLAALERAAGARQRAGPSRSAGGDRGVPCSRAHRRGHRLGAHRRALRRAGASSCLRRSSSSIAPSRSPCCSARQAGLEIVDALTAEPLLSDYHLLPSVRGDLLAKLGRNDEARAEFERAAALTQQRPRADASARARRRLRHLSIHRMPR